MSSFQKSLWGILPPITYLFLLCVSAFVTDWGIGRIQNRLTGHYLTTEARDDLSELRWRVTDLKAQLDRASSEVRKSASRTEPTPTQIRERAGSQRLRVYRLDRYEGRRTDGQKVPMYSIVLRGHVGGLVRFLRELESEFAFRPESITLQSADATGETISLTVVMPLRAI